MVCVPGIPPEFPSMLNLDQKRVISSLNDVDSILYCSRSTGFIFQPNNDYCATPQHSMSKSGGCQLHSCDFEGHRPYFRLLLPVCRVPVLRLPVGRQERRQVPAQAGRNYGMRRQNSMPCISSCAEGGDIIHREMMI